MFGEIPRSGEIECLRLSREHTALSSLASPATAGSRQSRLRRIPPITPTADSAKGGKAERREKRGFSAKGDKHQPVKLVIGFIFREESILDKAKNILRKEFGKIDYESQALAFGHTDYYETEFGKNLKRRFISFEQLIRPQNLAKIKIMTNIIEKKLSRNGLRSINIDPGYLDMAKVILASTKDYKHRIYLDKGIYAETTLFYQNKSFAGWVWTYPDYKSADYIAIFNHIRETYVGQLK